MRKVRNQKGFTIMELMIVIVIIGILIAIAVPAYQNFRARAQATACQANERVIASAAGLYYADKGSWPATVAAIIAEGHLDKLPVCPLGGTYTIAADGTVDCDAGLAPYAH